MQLSVAMCTFNGAAYLREQLDSISRQTRLPDKMVICDDGSTDDTAAICEAYHHEVSFPIVRTSIVRPTCTASSTRETVPSGV
ncbi:MAG: glycosyltransferase [Dehalococcoidia bacterium]|nr:glycosyltransferase [Dehalococcoidia bacterium]